MDDEQKTDPLLTPLVCRGKRYLNVSEPTWRRHWRPYLRVVRLSPKRIAVQESELLALIEARKSAASRAA